MSATLTPAELAARARATTGRKQATTELMVETLRDWQRRGIAEQVGIGWRLTPSGFAMFGAYVLDLSPNDEREAA